jgi:hypothetical protein
MAATSKFGFHLLQFRPHSRPHRLAVEQEVSGPRFPTDVREPEEVEGLWLSQSPRTPIPVRKATELNKTGLAFVKLELELRQPITKRLLELLGIATMLEPDHNVVRETHDDDVTPRPPISP